MNGLNRTTISLPAEDNYFVQEAFNVLRTNVLFSGQDVKVILLTSVDQNEGKSVLSLHLGHSLAELGKRVLVIDADLRKSVLAGRHSDAKNVIGLSETLNGMTTLSDAIYSTQYPNMFLLFSGAYPPNPVKLLNSVYFSDMLKAVKDIFDYVIVDTPPLGYVIDAAVIGANCDSALLVIGSDHVPYRAAREAVEQLRKSNCNVLGVVLNNVSSKKRDRYSHGKYKKYQYKKYEQYK